MTIDVLQVIAGALTGFVVGTTGVGGGALMTPILLLGFGMAPLKTKAAGMNASTQNGQKGTMKDWLGFFMTSWSVQQVSAQLWIAACVKRATTQNQRKARMLR